MFLSILRLTTVKSPYFIRKISTHFIIIIIPLPNLFLSLFAIRGNAKWSRDSCDGANVAMSDCPNRLRWTASLMNFPRGCTMIFTSPRVGSKTLLDTQYMGLIGGDGMRSQLRDERTSRTRTGRISVKRTTRGCVGDDYLLIWYRVSVITCVWVSTWKVGGMK